MKLTFTSFDVQTAVSELQKSIVGLRVNQIYDVDHKTYLIKLQKPEHKVVLLLESAARIHTTDYQLPKNPAPSGFSMKLRKHLRNKRLECIKQLGADRVVQMTFGSGPTMHHLILELYDRGNITLTDADYVILIILRPRTDGEDTRFAAHEYYPIESFRSIRPPPSIEAVTKAVQEAKPNLNVKKILNSMLDCGGGIVEHELTLTGLRGVTAAGIKECPDKLSQLQQVAERAQQHMVAAASTQGFIIQRQEQRGGLNGTSEIVLLQQEFHPMLYEQHRTLPHLQYDTFNQACDEFFQQLESQKLQQRAVQQERDALKKLENVRSDHTNRLMALKSLQEEDAERGQLIELNQQLVDAAIGQVRSALAHQLDWREIEEMLEEAREREDPVVMAIKTLSLITNSISMVLSNPYDCDEDDMLLDSDEEREQGTDSDRLRPTTVLVDLDLSAHANARRYYTSRRKAGTKVEKTMAASAAALKSATRKTKETIKEVQTTTSINKVRKVHWFEKFLWFISSENYLVLAGHDQQQNEVLVKRHMKGTDVYVHADLHGASSVLVKNPTGAAVPPGTLHQAGIMALCYSRAWAEKVVTSAWWVWGAQVSKSAPTGEYLTTGAFMVRGKKNFLPPSHLVYGFGFLFRLEESSIARHDGERRVKVLDGDQSDAARRYFQDPSMEDGGDIKEEAGSGDIKEEAGSGDIKEEAGSGDIKEEAGSGDIKEEGSGDVKGKDGGDVKEEEDAGEVKGEEDSGDEKEEELLLEDDKADSSASEGEEECREFPDTVVEMTHIRGDTYAVSTTAATIAPEEAPATEVATELARQRRKQRGGKVKPSVCDAGKGLEPVAEVATRDQGPAKPPKEESEAPKPGPLKRGQKSKLKKMKTKYKDQDDEERELRMHLLQSAGAKKEPKRQKGKKGKKILQVQIKNNENLKSSAKAEAATSQVQVSEEKEEQGDKPPPAAATTAAEEEEEEEEEDEPGLGSDDVAILAALTGQPVVEDELLYCVPVCAPYMALSNYKFKVKLTPGPGKKGKACRTAVSLFLSLKPQITREGDLLRAERLSDLARNVPGKVKVSAPNISKVRK